MNSISHLINIDVKHYSLPDVISFYKVDEPFGALSNMSGKYFHLQVNDVLIRSSEALYQACRFPNRPDLQKLIIEDKSPKGAKMRAKKYRAEFTRPDFESIKVDLMFWCLKVKLSQHPIDFGRLLERTSHKNIVEISKADNFWGALKNKENEFELQGKNVLGQLLMLLREYYLDNKGKMTLLKVDPLPIIDFKLLDQPILQVTNQMLKKT